MTSEVAVRLHRCADCAFWQPAFTYFGEPTGQGGCQFSTARNRKGDKLRGCDMYESEPLEGRKLQGVSEPISRSPLSTGSGTMGTTESIKECKSLIQFWKDRLAECRLLMSPSTVYLTEQTIKSLEELKQVKEGRNGN